MNNDLDQVATAFAEWRATRGRRGRTPSYLKKQAVTLSRKYAKTQIISRLGVNNKMLEEWIRESKIPAASFIDITPSAMPITPPQAVAVAVEWGGSTHLKLTGATPDVAALLILLRQGGSL